ncbi:hypothetical protein ACF09Y_26680 [Streptomyces massasporeus]|uniref:hypothetical protein n=1 Tax=Streptomyces massasporeus TaxID=67324 RepID=UPI0036FC5FA4
MNHSQALAPHDPFACIEGVGDATLEAYVAAHHPEHAPVSLVHSHSYDNTAYTDHRLAAHEPSTSDAYWPDSDDGDDDEGRPAAGERPEERVTVPDGWLRGWDRALLAQFTVATHDQALMATLPVRFSALRMLALSGRTVIVDEVHALPPFMRQTLSRLLHWLGALGCPVVLLSATLPVHISEQLVRSYLDGAGHPHPATAHLDCRPPTGAGSTPPPRTLPSPASTRPRPKPTPTATAPTSVSTRLRHPSYTDPEDTPARESRLERITQEIAPVARSGGCAAVYCATMADAQTTYTHLRTALDWPDGGPDGQPLLLHARLPGHQREALTRRIRTALASAGERPGRLLVVVTTSLLDMSLNIDVDVMVSDLAPLHTLLQRLGRLWRFDHIERPDWLGGGRPRLIVLEPTDHRGRTLLPPVWRPLDSPFLPLATAAYLARRPEQPLTLPDDVQQLVEAVHGDADALARTDAALRRGHALHQARTRTEEHHSLLHLVPAWHDTLSLSDCTARTCTPARPPPAWAPCPAASCPSTACPAAASLWTRPAPGRCPSTANRPPLRSARSSSTPCPCPPPGPHKRPPHPRLLAQPRPPRRPRPALAGRRRSLPAGALWPAPSAPRRRPGTGPHRRLSLFQSHADTW